MKTVCVFAGSSRGVSPAYAEAARELGREIAKRNLRMVYGGGNVGLMGECAHAAQEGGSEVVGERGEHWRHGRWDLLEVLGAEG